jgi:hypothetical protein
MAVMAPPTEQRYAAIVEVLQGGPGVTQGSPGKGFGASALKVHGKIFAMLSSRGQFVVKLPRPHLDLLAAAGSGERFDPGHGRTMNKEWLALGPISGRTGWRWRARRWNSWSPKARTSP